MDIEELLPGIEEYLSETLASENLSGFAEQRRLYFLERIDIIKLPPSVPPREGRVIPPEVLKESEAKSGIPSNRCGSDFAATQREISRSWAGSTGQVNDVSSAPKRKSVGDDGNEDEIDEDESDSDKVKDYVDIDTAEIQNIRAKISSTKSRGSINHYDDEEVNKDLSQADIDALIRHGVAASNRNSVEFDGSGRPSSFEESNGITGSTIDSKDTQVDDIDEDGMENDYEIPVAHQQLLSEEGSATPPIPPRGIKFSDSGSKNSVDAGDDVPPELPYRPPLPRRNEVYTKSGCSDKSDPDISGDGDSTSYETFDEDEEQTTDDLKGKMGIKLPRRAQKKKSTLRMNKKLTKSRSSSICEISVPFRKLPNIDISGELYHKGKLSWNRRLVAISNGCLAMYKPDKEARPLLAIPLMGYEAAVDEREGKRGFEIKLTHPENDSHLFSVDFKEWANLWKEHINEVSKGRTPAKYHTHLARTISGDFTFNGSKTDLTGSNSNLSTGSDGGTEDTGKPRLRAGSKVMRMGSFAFRASQFFENISKRNSITKRKLSAQSSNDSIISKGHDLHDGCNGIVEESSLSSTSTGNIPASALTPTSDLNLPVFSDSNSSSIPNSPCTPMDTTIGQGDKTLEGQGRLSGEIDQDAEESPDIRHKGHLYIFSTFNRRRWGKRWCLVRNNTFECYRSTTSGQCELHFLLGDCKLRRAEIETSSPLALMLLEADREVITVEPVCEADMPGWVKVLMAETATLFIPEGLEEYVKKAERRPSDAPSTLSFSVLKQWDMDITSCHDYEEPVEISSLTEADIPFSNENPSSVSVKEKAEKTLSSRVNEELPILEALEKQQICEVKGSPSASLHNKNKNTTDSGFYSVKGNNSDSDMEDADTSSDRLQNPSTSISNVQTPNRESVRRSLCKEPISNVNRNSEIDSVVPLESNSQSNCTNYAEDSLAQNITATASSTSSSSSVSTCHRVNSSSSVSSFSNPSQMPKSDSFSTIISKKTSSSGVSYLEDNQVDLKTNSSLINNQSKMVLCEPESTDEYTPVLKRSERIKSISPESSVPSPEKLTNSSSMSEDKGNESQSNNQSTLLLEHTTAHDDNNIEENFLIEQNTKEYTITLTQDSTYEPVNPSSPDSSSVVQECALASSSFPPESVVVVELDTSGQLVEVKTESVENNCVTIHQDITIDDTKVNETFSEDLSLTSKDSKHLHQDSSDTESKLEHLISSMGCLQLHDNEVKKDISDLVKEHASCPDGQDSIPSTSSTSSPSFLGPTSKSKPTLLTVSVDSSHGNGTISETPASPSPVCVSSLISNPNVSEEELKNSLGNLREKKSHLKRKRIAVHDKRQRVSSDEERLACEKEFASLERDAEAVDRDIGLLQNHLEKLSGDMLEAFKAENKKRSGSKKRRGKRN